MYDIKTSKDIEDVLKYLMGGTMQEMLEAEMDEHLGYNSYSVCVCKSAYGETRPKKFWSR